MPEVGGISQVSILKNVLLPAPLGPMMPRSSPCSTAKSMSLLATMPPNAWSGRAPRRTGPVNGVCCAAARPTLATGAAAASAPAPPRAPAGARPRAASRRVEQVPHAADQAAAQEAHQQHEHDAEHQLPGAAEAERRLQEIAQVEPDRRRRPAARTACRRRRSRSASPAGPRCRSEGLGRHEALQHAEQPAGEAGIGGGDDEGGQLVAVRRCGRPRRRAAGCRGSR